MEICIEKADPKYAQKLYEVLLRVWRETYPNESLGITIHAIDSYFSSHRRNILEMFRCPLATEIRYVARIEKDIVGVCLADQEEEINRLDALYVLPSWQRRGIGGALWRKTCSRFDSTKITVTTVASYNAEAIGFYTRLGFVRIQANERHYLEPSPAFIPELEMHLKGK